MILLKVLLFLLKFIGIALLAVLGLILFLLCILLFVPIRYDVTCGYKDKLTVRAKGSFLLRLVRVRFEMHGKEQKLTAKALWWNLLSGKGKKERRRAKPKKEPSRNIPPEPVPEVHKEAEKPEDILPQVRENIKDTKDEVSEEVCRKTDSTSDGRFDRKSPEKSSKTSSRKSQKKSKSAKASGKEKQGSVVDTVRTVITLIKENKSVLSFLWKQIKALFKHILPGSHVINVKLGLDDPALLGEIIGAVALVRAATNLVINITPDFEKKIIEADCRFKGRIRLGKLLFIALRVYFNKDVKNILNKLKNS